MSGREKLSPGFLISHDADEAFPTEEERSSLGYEPLDLFLNAEIPQDSTLDPRLILGSDSADELIENLSADLYLVFRYTREDMDIEAVEEVPGGERELPGIQRELYQASLRPDSDFVTLAEILSDTVEQVTEAEYMYPADTRGEGRTQRCEDFGEYLKVLEGQSLKIWPETYGINEIEIRPGRMTAAMSLYQQEVQVHREEPEFRRRGIEDEEDFWEEVELNYSESEIDEIEERLESEGFQVRREYLPKSISPPDI
ncbi:MAG: hypothetical protein ABEJ03_02950 [Candidatus Nanohaloarchaea archaeon]